MSFEVEVPERRGLDGTRKVAAPLPSRDRNRYAGIFAGYSKQFEESFPGKAPQKMRTFRFLVTHASALGKYLPLEKMVVGKYKATIKWSYSKNAMSGLAAIVAAVCGEDVAAHIESLPKEQKGAAISEALEGAIGKYCTFSAWPNYYIKDGRERYNGNRIDGKSFSAADERLKRIEAAVAEKLDFSYTQDATEPLRYLSSPKGVEIEQDTSQDTPAQQNGAAFDDADSEIPF